MLWLLVVILGILAAIFVSSCSAEAKMLIFPMVFEGFWPMELLPRGHLWWLQGPFWRSRWVILGPCKAILGPWRATVGGPWAMLWLLVVILGILAAIFVSSCSAEAKMLIFPMVFEGFWPMELLPRSHL